MDLFTKKQEILKTLLRNSYSVINLGSSPVQLVKSERDVFNMASKWIEGDVKINR